MQISSKQSATNQKEEVNCGPQSETMWSGSLWRQTIFCTKSWAVVLAEGKWLQRVKWTILVRQSMTIKATVWPSDTGSSTMKHRLLVDQHLAGVSRDTKMPRDLAQGI